MKNPGSNFNFMKALERELLYSISLMDLLIRNESRLKAIIFRVAVARSKHIFKAAHLSGVKQTC
jgi:hypothetical protein